MDGALDGIAVIIDNNPAPHAMVSRSFTSNIIPRQHLQHRRQSLSNHDSNLLHRQHQSTITNNQNRASSSLRSLSTCDVCAECCRTGVADTAEVDLREEAGGIRSDRS